MYIINKHLHILKLIKNNPELKLKEIADLLDMNQQHLKLYLQDIYFELYNLSSTNISTEILLDKIYSFSSAKSKLKKVQIFSKNDKIFYMVFRLLRDHTVKLSCLSEELEITKRNLNYYLKEISPSLKKYNLKICVSNKGIKLLGSPYSKKKFTQNLIFKFLIEREFLPKKIRNEVLNFLKIDNFHSLKKDIYNIIDFLKCDCLNHNIYAFLSLYLAFKDKSKNNIIKTISLDKSLKYKPSHYTKDFFFNLFKFLQNSNFKNLNINYINEFFFLINSFYFYKYKFNENTLKNGKKISDIFFKYTGKKIKHNSIFYNKLIPWIGYCELKKIFSIDDMSFLNFNLMHLSNSNILKMTKEISLILPFFTLFEGISLWYQLSSHEIKQEHNILVFKNLSQTTLPLIVNEIYKKHSIKINNSINVRFLKEYLLNNNIDNIITVENFKIHNNNINIKNLFLPLPNYKKST